MPSLPFGDPDRAPYGGTIGIGIGTLSEGIHIPPDPDRSLPSSRSGSGGWEGRRRGSRWDPGPDPDRIGPVGIGGGGACRRRLAPLPTIATFLLGLQSFCDRARDGFGPTLVGFAIQYTTIMLFGRELGEKLSFSSPFHSTSRSVPLGSRKYTYLIIFFDILSLFIAP